ncbi:MAG: hypothetical protein ISS29_04240 [Candidatus Marinimicrobia bacterium]|nr:hypothetical protein [Candidatus Neomarinimicrobiota bacterium]
MKSFLATGLRSVTNCSGAPARTVRRAASERVESSYAAWKYGFSGLK